MRRKKKYNIYTNATIKRSSSSGYYCTACKGVCKIVYDAEIDENSISQNHLGYSGTKKKLHLIGEGSLMPGKKFVVFSKKYHRKRRYSYSFEKNRKNIKRGFQNLFKDQIDEYSFIKYADSQIM